MNIEKTLILGGVIALTSACSSSSGSGDAALFDAAAYAEMTYSERLTLASDMNNAAVDAGIADSGALPTTGTSSYNGTTYLVLDDKNSDEVIAMMGDLEVIVSFDTDSLDGIASDFVDNTDTVYAGELIVTDNYLDRGADPALGFVLEGQLVNDDTGIEYDLNTDVEGNFYGTGSEYIVGGVSGAPASNSSSDGAAYTVTGTIIGELQ